MRKKPGMSRARLSLAGLAGVVLLLLAGAASAQGTATVSDPPAPDAGPEWRWRVVTVGADVAMTGAYVWRGFVLHDGACLQPDLWAKFGGFTVTSWLNVRNTVTGDNHLNEHDLIVDYSREVRVVTLSAGWTNYRIFGNQSGQTNEFYAGLRAGVPLQPGVQVYKDVQQGSGTYVSLSAIQEWPVGTRATGTAQVAIGHNNHMYIDRSGFSDVAVTVKLSVPVPSARVALQPAVTYSRSLMPDQFPSRLFAALSMAFK